MALAIAGKAATAPASPQPLTPRMVGLPPDPEIEAGARAAGRRFGLVRLAGDLALWLLPPISGFECSRGPVFCTGGVFATINRYGFGRGASETGDRSARHNKGWRTDVGQETRV